VRHTHSTSVTYRLFLKGVALGGWQARRVWCVTGTPFPNGDKSMYGIHCLLGLKLKLHVSNDLFARYAPLSCLTRCTESFVCRVREGDELTNPSRHARPIPLTPHTIVVRSSATRTPRKCGDCPLFKGPFLCSDSQPNSPTYGAGAGPHRNKPLDPTHPFEYLKKRFYLQNTPESVGDEWAVINGGGLKFVQNTVHLPFAYGALALPFHPSPGFQRVDSSRAMATPQDGLAHSADTSRTNLASAVSPVRRLTARRPSVPSPNRVRAPSFCSATRLLRRERAARATSQPIQRAVRESEAPVLPPRGMRTGKPRLSLAL
jgi:hypothetical protein